MKVTVNPIPLFTRQKHEGKAIIEEKEYAFFAHSISRREEEPKYQIFIQLNIEEELPFGEAERIEKLISDNLEARDLW